MELPKLVPPKVKNFNLGNLPPTLMFMSVVCLIGESEAYNSELYITSEVFVGTSRNWLY